MFSELLNWYNVEYSYMSNLIFLVGMIYSTQGLLPTCKMGRYSIYFRMFHNVLWIISLWFTKFSFLINVCEEWESKHIRRGLSLSNHFRLVTYGLVTSVVVPLSSLGVKEANLMLPAFCFWIHYKVLFPIQIKLNESWYIPHISHTGCYTLVSNTRYKSAPSIRVLYVRSTYLRLCSQI